MSAEAIGLPGATLYHCPLCTWVHARQPPASLSDTLDTEAAVADHLRTHPLTEWVQEVVHLQEIVAAYRKVYDDGDAMDETIRHLAACGKCDPVGYDHTLCDGYSAAVSADAERLRKEAGQRATGGSGDIERAGT